jgi:transcriptional regulator with XRE-family HTH domain
MQWCWNVPKAPPIRGLDRDRLTALLAENGMNKSDLARLAQANPSQAGHWLSGTHVPAGDRVEELCQHFGCSPSYLFGRSTEDCQDYLVRAVGRELGPSAARVLAEWIQITRGNPAPPPPPKRSPARPGRRSK